MSKFPKEKIEFLNEIKKECEEILKEDGDFVDICENMKFAEFVLDFIIKNGKEKDYYSQYANFFKEMKENYIEENFSGTLKKI